MRRGIRGNPELERPELSPHYDEAKNAFKGRTTWCSVCKGFECQMNEVECKKFGATLELLEFLHDLPASQRPNFTMHDFFTKEEIEYFLQNFTTQLQWNDNKISTKLNGLDLQLIWPRQIVGDIRMNAVRRWDQKTRRNYMQKGWSGFLRPYMFEKAAEGTKKLYDRFEEDMDEIDTALSPTESENSISDEFKSKVSFFANSTEDIQSDGPFSDDDSDTDFNGDDSPGWSDANWRRALERKINEKENALEVS